MDVSGLAKLQSIGCKLVSNYVSVIDGDYLLCQGKESINGYKVVTCNLKLELK